MNNNHVYCIISYIFYTKNFYLECISYPPGQVLKSTIIKKKNTFDIKIQILVRYHFRDDNLKYSALFSQ